MARKQRSRPSTRRAAGVKPKAGWEEARQQMRLLVQQDIVFAGFFDAADASNFVESLYRAGARRVYVEHTDTLHVELPSGRPQAIKVMELIGKQKPDELDVQRGIVRAWWD